MIKLLKTNNHKILKALREKRGNMNRETNIKIKKQKQKKTYQKCCKPKDSGDRSLKSWKGRTEEWSEKRETVNLEFYT